MTRLILIRHGYSSGNKAKEFCGQRDVPLDAIGYRQAEEMAAYVIATFAVDAVYTSDLCRARDTVKPIADALHLPLLPSAALREVDVGDWQGKTAEEVRKIYPESLATYESTPGLARFDGGESYALLTARILPEIDRIAKANEGKTVVIGTHGGVIRALRAHVDGIPLSKIGDLPQVHNASLTLAEYEGGTVTLTAIDRHAYLTDVTA